MTNKLLLAAIALGLWANAAIWLVRPVQAQSDQVAGSVQQMADELRQLVEPTWRSWRSWRGNPDHYLSVGLSGLAHRNNSLSQSRKFSSDET
jgi:hypothetical protein